MPEPIERQKVYELLRQRLAEEIGRGRLGPGDHLPPERHLAATYEVGRSSVREALRMLESQGLIEAGTSGGFTVARDPNPLSQPLEMLVQLTDASAAELFEVRRVLEVETAGLAAARRTDEDIRVMLAAIEEMAAGISSGDRYIAADVQFHVAVAMASGNRIAAYVMQAIRGVMRRALKSAFRIPGIPERSNEQHRAILEAIKDGAPEEARLRMWEHITTVEREIEETTRQTTAASPSVGVTPREGAAR